MFDTAIDSFHRAGNAANLATTLAEPGRVLRPLERPEIAATVYGASRYHGAISVVISLPGVVDTCAPCSARAVRPLRRRRGGHGTRRSRRLRPRPDRTARRQIADVTDRSPLAGDAKS